ncbi:beta-glucuronidase-like [Schistocerca piceifrons]|uniref:beta-glucuronidase-like n=1 Tax=Schistocerca piceifrons TaxID=274613 RepID=UPI001F5EAA62|nr:beta-glucuronidase-like [Schistocerca piceifrons]
MADADGGGGDAGRRRHRRRRYVVCAASVGSMSVVTAMLVVAVVLSATRGEVSLGGMLYPRESESREVRSLDGVWDFRLSDNLQGYWERWYEHDLRSTGEVMMMPVPASYNDVTQLKEVRDHVGLVWYDRRFFVPRSWQSPNIRVWLRFGSVHYVAQVWVNGELAMAHEIGHLPFQTSVTGLLKFGASNRLTVAVDNTLLQTSVPQGSLHHVDTANGTREYQSYSFDFFNYAGIHRPVLLYTTPSVFIDDLNVATDYSLDGTGTVRYNVTYAGYSMEAPQCRVDLLDADGVVVGSSDSSNGLQGEIRVPDAHAWWPYLMHPRPGYLYTLQVRLTSSEWGTEDVYRLPVGIRRLAWDNSSLLINDRPVYLRGFGRHEDADIRGKGLDLATVAKDHNLLRWVGANSYRTSHYPYADEVMDFADQQGFLIIDECPSVNTENYSPALLQKHKDSLTELIRRDKNRPSVIMWSVANEARTQLFAAESYFREIVQHVKSLDPSRPTTMAIARGFSEDRAAPFIDIIAFNRYNAWYSNGGLTETIVPRVVAEAEGWYARFGKPVFVTEYGADTLEGLHLEPEYIWSEEYQEVLFSEHFKAFDILREKGYFIGEMIWNFADFKTAQTYTRVGGNKKGIFTRARQPKSAAHLVRKRYWSLAERLDGAQPPADTRRYVIDAPPKDSANAVRREL